MTVKAGQAITATADHRLAEAELRGVRSDSCPAAEAEGHSPTAAPHELQAPRQSALAIPAIAQGSTATVTGLAANRRLTTVLRSLTQLWSFALSFSLSNFSRSFIGGTGVV